MNTQIKLFMFDFAGVVATTKMFPAVADYLAQRHIIDTPELRETFKKALYESQYSYMLGEESTEAFWEKTGKIHKIPYADFIEAFENWFTVNKELLPLIKKLRENYRVVLVSDNFAACSPAIRKNELINPHFDKLYFSDEEHVVKQDGKLFSLVLEKEGVLPGEAFFTDDQEKLVAVANGIGINARIFQGAEELTIALKNMGINL